MKIEMDGDIINDSTTADRVMKQTRSSRRDTSMKPRIEGEVIADGALGDDERTETESLDREGKQIPGCSPLREPLRGTACDENIGAMETNDDNPPSPTDDSKSLNNSHSSNEGGLTGNESGPGKKKRRRRGKHKGGKHHRKYKPYHKLSWSERKEVDDRETKRANLKREAAFKSGHPVAPYNTTQFLMEDHSKNEGISPSLKLEDKTDDLPTTKENRLSKDSSHCSGGSAGDSEDEYLYDSSNDEELFLAKDFSEAYDSIHVERLQKMTKEELVKDYLELEAKVENLEKKLKDSDTQGVILNNNLTDVHNGVCGEEHRDMSDAKRTTKEAMEVDSVVRA